MSLDSCIRIASNTLRADQIALQVVGQNIANANTPGYIREDVILTPAPTQRLGGLLLGLGVQVQAVVQKIDNFLEERLRGSVSQRASSEAQEDAYIQLEQMINELGDTDLSTSLSNFFASIDEILNQPESVSVRNLAVLEGATLAQDVNRLANRVTQVRSDLNDRVQDMADRINRLTEEIQTLNVRIAETEGGDISNSDAVGLRDQRLQALEDLATLINIRVEEQTSGGVTVYCGGDFLVYEGIRREVKAVDATDRGATVAEIRLAETDSPLEATAGELCGLTAARDQILGGFLDRLDEFAGILANEFNKVYSSGQGLSGYDELTSVSAVTDPNARLDEAGLAFAPTNGSFHVLVTNTQTGVTKNHTVNVDLLDLPSGGSLHEAGATTLNQLAAVLDAIDGLKAEVTGTGNLRIASESSDREFAFGEDTSGVLAALGLNTFFTGSTARDLGVNQVVREAPATFAASAGGIGVDTDVAVRLAAFMDRPIASQGDQTASVLYDRLMNETTQGSTVAQAVAEGARVFEETLRGQKSAVSGVSLDEEAIKLMAYQRSFQASARLIATLNDLLDILVSL